MKKAVHCGGVDDVDVGARANVKRSLVLQSWSSLFEKKKQASRAHNEKKKKNFHLQPIHHILRVRSKPKKMFLPEDHENAGSKV